MKEGRLTLAEVLATQPQVILKTGDS